MARTSRSGVPANNMDALDTINLDTMFTDEDEMFADGPDLFAGISDLGLGNIPEMGNNDTTNDKDTTTKSSPAPAPAAPAAAEEETLPRRRKTTRKKTAPSFFDDDSTDNEPPKKKSRTKKGAGTKRGRGKKGAETPTAKVTKKSKASKAAAPAPPPALTKTASGAVSTPPMVGAAAVGQFGTRQKKVAGSKTAKSKTAKQRVDSKARVVLPTAANRAAAAAASAVAVPAPPPPPPVVAPVPAPPPAPPKPAAPQSLYCGLPPSNSIFYPFMAALPSEVALKNRKVYTLLDRVHSSFVGYFGHGSASNSTPPTLPQGAEQAKEDEPIFKLTQEAFREEKNATTHATPADRSKAIGVAIGAIRKTISLFDKGKLAQDLLAVCALLRRQHDFVKQNNANMERWCRDHFSEEDFAAVYQEGKKKQKPSASAPAPGGVGAPVPSVLSTFKGPQVKVKILCAGFKEPKTQLLAALPVEPKRTLVTRTGRKKTETNAAGAAALATASSSAAIAAAAAAAAADLNYARQTPQRRRKTVSALISRVAQTLESRQNQKEDKRRQSVLFQEKRRKDVAEDTSVTVIHTGGMWKYMQESGYFEDAITDAELQERFDSIQPMKVERTMNGVRTDYMGKPSLTESGAADSGSGALTDRLIGLLVEEGDESDSDTKEEDDGTITDSDSSIDDTLDLLDLSDLTENERALVQLRMMGLAVDDNGLVKFVQTVANGTGAGTGVSGLPSSHLEARAAKPQPPKSSFVPSNSQQGDEDDDDIDDIVAGMIEDLQRTNSMISARADFAQNLARCSIETPEAASRRRQREASIGGRGAALLKRNKEAKAKAMKAKAKQDDDLKLPW